jgi:hypothetical protein
MEVSLKLHAHLSLVLSVGLLATGFVVVPRAYGQLAGHYIGAATGLENGTTAPRASTAPFFPS